MIAEWNIQSPARQCAATGRPFEEAEQVLSFLLWRDGTYERLDYAAGAEPAEAPDAATLLSSWKAAYKTPVPPPPETLTKDDAEGLLRRLLAVRDPEYAHSSYILGLMLERKRILKELDRQDVDGNPVLIYEHVPSGETWIIPHPPLKLAEMEKVQNQVGLLLAGRNVPGGPDDEAPVPVSEAEAPPVPAESTPAA
jgi:hypothetical protein